MMDCVVRATGDEFIRTLGVVLTKIVADVAPEYGPISCFNSMNAPPISDYLTRIARYVNCSNECFVLALVYIDRIMRLHRFSVSVLNIHRLLITSVMLAAKFSDDVYYSNSFYAQVGGIKVAEMNQLEAQFLILIKYHLFVDARDYENCRKGVESSSTKIYTLSNACAGNAAVLNHSRNAYAAHSKGVVHTGAMPSSSYVFNGKYAPKGVANNLLVKPKDVKRCFKPSKCQVVKSTAFSHGLNPGYLYNFPPNKLYNYSDNSYVDPSYMDGYLMYQYGMDYPYSRTDSSITVSTAASFDGAGQVDPRVDHKLNKFNSNLNNLRLSSKLDECEAFVNALENRYKDTLKRKCSAVQQFGLVKNHW